MRRLFVLAAMGAMFIGLPTGHALADPQGKVDRIKIDTTSFHQKPCTDLNGKKVATVDFTFTSRGNGTVRITVADGTRVLSTKQVTVDPSGKTTVNDVQVPEVDGKPAFQVESTMAFDQTSEITVSQVYCAMAEQPAAMSQPNASTEQGPNRVLLIVLGLLLVFILLGGGFAVGRIQSRK